MITLSIISVAYFIIGLSAGKREHRTNPIQDGPEPLLCAIFWPIVYCGPIAVRLVSIPSDLLNKVIDKLQDKKQLPKAKARYNEDHL